MTTPTELPKRLATTLEDYTDEEIARHLMERKMARNAEVQKRWPRAAEVLLKEGGTWIVWAENEARLDPKHEEKGGYVAVHAIKFEDGSIWDVVNGWRAQ